MEIIDAIRQRRSVRQYEDRAIEEDILAQLKAEIDACNDESGLHIQLVTNEPKAFSGFMAHYGKFSGVTNYIALVGKKNKNLDELCGYYGERIVLKAQRLGLNTCWVALTYKKVPSAFTVGKGEKLAVVISLGYGKNQGFPRKSKSVKDVSNAGENTPEWFKNGVEMALLAPTAVNQQKFKLIYADGKVTAKAGLGFYAKMDLGIVKYHFEIGSGKKLLND
ncbi:MAG: nitroreductase [Clostridia bacterium]|nr:nitroreductase [Clostridia bacterium]